MASVLFPGRFFSENIITGVADAEYKFGHQLLVIQRLILSANKMAQSFVRR